MTSIIEKLTSNGDPRSTLTIEDCTELVRVLRAQQNRIGELLQERNELAARVERLREAGCILAEECIFLIDKHNIHDESDNSWLYDHQTPVEFMQIANEAPPAALEALKVKWQADGIKAAMSYVSMHVSSDTSAEDYADVMMQCANARDAGDDRHQDDVSLIVENWPSWKREFTLTKYSPKNRAQEVCND